MPLVTSCFQETSKIPLQWYSFGKENTTPLWAKSWICVVTGGKALATDHRVWINMRSLCFPSHNPSIKYISPPKSGSYVLKIFSVESGLRRWIFVDLCGLKGTRLRESWLNLPKLIHFNIGFCTQTQKLELFPNETPSDLVSLQPPLFNFILLTPVTWKPCLPNSFWPCQQSLSFACSVLASSRKTLHKLNKIFVEHVRHVALI